MLFGKRVFIGLDIGCHSVKAAVLDQNKKYIIDLVESEIFPERSYIDQVPDENLVIDKIKGTLSKYTGPNSKLNAVISSSLQGDGGVCSYLEIPKLKKEEEQMAIQSDARKQLPFSIDEAAITYIPVPALGINKENKGIFFAAIKKEIAEKQLELMKKCGISGASSQVYVIALINEFIGNHGRTPDKFTVIVHAGACLTSVIIIKDGFPYYSRNFAIAGNNFTYAFQMGNQSSWQAAEKYKMQYDVTKKEVPIEPPVIKWLENVKNSIDGFTKQHAEQSPVMDKLYLTGGTSQWQGLDARLSENIGIPVVTDSWQNIKPPENLKNLNAGTYNIALGTAFLT